MMHNTDQNGMVVEGRQRDMMRDAARERLSTQLPPARHKVLLARIFCLLLTALSRVLILSGRNLQTRAGELSELLDTATETEPTMN